jgi:hypothetical protein
MGDVPGASRQWGETMTQIDEKLSRRAMLRKAAAAVGVAGASALAAGCAPRAAAPPPPPAPVIPPAPPAAAAVPAPPPPGPAAEAKESKREARYQNHPHGRERCGRCAHFLAPNGCEIVEGRISPRGWCRHFLAKA